MQPDLFPNDPQTPAAPVPDRELTGLRSWSRSPEVRRLRLQALLYLLTCLTTFAAGVVGWEPMLLGFDDYMLA